MKKIIIYIITVLMFLYLLIMFDYSKMDKINTIKNNNYHTIVLVTDNTNLYKKINEKYEKIGTIKKNTKLYLDDLKIKDNYFKLKNSNYYIDYRYVKKTNDDILKYDSINYFSNQVTLNKNTELSNQIVIDEEINVKVLIKEDEYYYISFNNQLFKVNKSYINESSDNDLKTEIDNISVLNITNTENIDAVLNYLHQNNYQTLTLDQYEMWMNNKINTYDKTVLLISDLEIDNNLPKKYNILINKVNKNDFILNNMTSTKNKKNSYEINNTSLETLKKILLKEEIIYEKATSIPVLNYHFFYDTSKNEVCNEVICLELKKFEEHLIYLNNNGYRTLTMDEFINWYEGKIELPKKSVLITIDDGAMGTSLINGNILIPLLEKYQINATLFLITAWWPKENYKSDYLEIESHGYDIHKKGNCNSQMINCLTYNELKEDIQKSKDILNSSQAFCYPFYTSNDNAIKILEELDFKVAFGGGNINAKRSSNRYYLPRYPILSNITLNEFINIVK